MGVHGSGEEDEDLGVEEGEVIEAVLPADDGANLEQAGAGEEDEDQEDDDLGIGGGRGVGRVRELWEGGRRRKGGISLVAGQTAAAIPLQLQAYIPSYHHYITSTAHYAMAKPLPGDLYTLQMF